MFVKRALVFGYLRVELEHLSGTFYFENCFSNRKFLSADPELASAGVIFEGSGI